MKSKFFSLCKLPAVASHWYLLGHTLPPPKYLRYNYSRVSIYFHEG